MVTTKSKTPAKPLVELHAALDPYGHASPNLQVSWCVEDELTQHIVDEQWQDPHLVVVVRYKSFTEWCDESIYTPRLSDGWAMVSFARPGEHEIRAFVIDGADKDVADEIGSLKTWRRDEKSVLNDDGSEASYRMPRVMEALLRYKKKGLCVPGAVVSNIVIEPEMFPLPPGEAVSTNSVVRAVQRARKWIVNEWHPRGTRKLRDQCDYRNRTIWSMFFFVVLMPLLLVIKVWFLLVVFILGGVYPFHLTPKTFFSAKEDPSTSETHSVYFQERDRNGYWAWRSPQWFLLSPHVLFALPGLVFALFQTHVGYTNPEELDKPRGAYHVACRWGWWHTFAFVDAIYLGIGLVVLAGFGIYAGADAIKSFFSNSFLVKSKRARKEAALAAERAAIAAELADMSCDKIGGKALTFADLPKHKRSLHMRFLNTKSKVCRPYARQ